MIPCTTLSNNKMQSSMTRRNIIDPTVNVNASHISLIIDMTINTEQGISITKPTVNDIYSNKRQGVN